MIFIKNKFSEHFEMKEDLRPNVLWYFSFFHRLIGNGFIFIFFLSFSVSLLDGVGLAIFIPLLQFTDSKANSASRELLGSFNYIIDLFNWLHLPINIYSILLIMVLVFSTKGFLNFWQLNKQLDLRLAFIKKIRFGLTDDLGELSYEGFLKLDAGKIQNILTSEVSKLLTAVSHFLGAIKGSVILLTYFTLAFLANWNFAILVAAGAVLSHLFFKNIFSGIKKASEGISQKGNYFNSYLIQAVHYFKYLKATNNYGQFSNKMKNVIFETEALNREIGFKQSITSSVREPLIIIIVAIVIIVQTSLGHSLGSIILSILLFYRSLGHLIAVQTSWQGFMQASGCISTLKNFTDEINRNKEIQAKEKVVSIEKSINFQNVSFYYGSKKVLEDINIEITKNQTIALVGESGSGKTTLANLISGLIKPTTGSFFIDGTPIENYNLNSYRRRIGYISQEEVIFNDNIFNNITIWAARTKENLERFWDVVEKASLTSLIKNLDEKEFTPLGDHGILISGGQKQRISIARELFREVDILIMDEATSALDSETERYIQESIEKLRGLYTIVVISHRLSTIKNADNIYLLDKGKILAHGSFSKVIQSSPKFQRMVMLQEV